MGPNDIGFYKRNGEHFRFYYPNSDNEKYSLMKEYFPVFSQCYFNGPMKSELAAAVTIVIGEEEGYKETWVAPGWKHWYLDFGNHLVIKEEFYQAIKDILEGVSNGEITFDWEVLLDEAGFAGKVDEIEKNIGPDFVKLDSKEIIEKIIYIRGRILVYRFEEAIKNNKQLF